MSVSDIRLIKNKIREKSKKFRQQLDSDTKNQLDGMIYEKIIALKPYRACEIILTYVSTSIEVDTLELIKNALAEKKTVAVPRCVPDKREMEFYIISSFDDLEFGTFNVLEPKTDVCEKLTSFKNSLCIVPGLSFDCEGYRIGYGKGYYDRFLSVYDGVTVGICYKKCVEWKFPHGFFDRPVDLLLTEKFVRRTGEINRKE